MTLASQTGRFDPNVVWNEIELPADLDVDRVLSLRRGDADPVGEVYRPIMHRGAHSWYRFDHVPRRPSA